MNIGQLTNRSDSVAPIQISHKTRSHNINNQQPTSHPYFAAKTIKAVTRLSAGLNHQVYKVELGDETVITRQAKTGNNLQPELPLQQAIAAFGYAPRVLAFATATQPSVIEYIDGTHHLAKHWPAEQLSAFAKQLATIHQLPQQAAFSAALSAALSTTVPTLQLQQQIAAYRTQVSLSASAAALVTTAVQQLTKLRHIPATAGLCHHDLIPENILCQGNRQVIIDWEFAAHSDVFFDLAGFIIEHQLEQPAANDFLTAYLSVCRHGHKAQSAVSLSPTQVSEKLHLMKIAYALICWLWHQIPGPDGPDNDLNDKQKNRAVFYRRLLSRCLSE